MFVQLVFLDLPCRFVSVVWAHMQIRSSRLFEVVHVNSVGQVIRSRVRPGEQARIKKC